MSGTDELVENKGRTLNSLFESLMIAQFLWSHEAFLFSENKMLYKHKPEIPYEWSEQNGTEKKNSNYSDSNSNGRDSDS